jgi:Na+/H+ antiporter NhaD/arsenite permease-like protein
METAVFAIFALVYLGLILGGLPGLALDRTGVALLGALALMALGVLTPVQAWAAIDVSTIALLFGMMLLSGLLAESGFYAAVTRRIARLEISPPRLLLTVILVAGLLSAVLVNDIVCLAMAPLVIEGCVLRRLDPVPFLLGLAAGSNIGSAATLIGNPQNMLIGQSLRLDFGGYLVDALVPCVLGLLVAQLVIVLSVRGRWVRELPAPPLDATPLDRPMATKGLLAALALMLAFLCTPWPREVLALGVAGFLLLSRRTRSRQLLGRVDGQLLLLFMGLFVVNRALQDTGRVQELVDWLAGKGFRIEAPASLFLLCVPLANTVSNVPAVMLLLPHATHPQAGAVLALASTLAGNLLLVGSIANLIVVDQAARLGVRIGWREHARVGLPIGIVTLAIAASWLALRAGA